MLKLLVCEEPLTTGREKIKNLIERRAMSIKK
jgi:hypothetical protein